MFGRLGPVELILILAIALVIFGPSKLPELGKALGKTIRGFRNETNKISEEINEISSDLKGEGKKAKKNENEG